MNGGERLDKELKELGTRIRETRKKCGFTQLTFSEKLGVSPSYMSEIELGKTRMGIDIFMRITETLQVSADWLLRTNIPSVTAIYNEEVNSILSDCTSSEIENLIGVMRDMKKAIHSAKHSGKD